MTCKITIVSTIENEAQINKAKLRAFYLNIRNLLYFPVINK